MVELGSSVGSEGIGGRDVRGEFTCGRYDFMRRDIHVKVMG